MLRQVKILITGANGFLGKNLIEKLVVIDNIDVLHYDLGTSDLLLEKNLSECDFLFHFAAVHRPKDSGDFYRVNDKFFSHILDILKKHNNPCPVILTSSIQALDNNDYGRSKKIAEDTIKKYGKDNNVPVVIYRLHNVFGKWAAPNHHSVVATFCYNISRELPITISDREITMEFYYIDDVINSFLDQINSINITGKDGITRLPEKKIHRITLGELSDTFYYFHKCNKDNVDPEINSEIMLKLFLTYNSYKPQ